MSEREFENNEYLYLAVWYSNGEILYLNSKNSTENNQQ